MRTYKILKENYKILKIRTSSKGVIEQHNTTATEYRFKEKTIWNHAKQTKKINLVIHNTALGICSQTIHRKIKRRAYIFDEPMNSFQSRITFVQNSCNVFSCFIITKKTRRNLFSYLTPGQKRSDKNHSSKKS